MVRVTKHSRKVALFVAAILMVFSASMVFASSADTDRNSLAQTQETFCTVADARVVEHDENTNRGTGGYFEVDLPNQARTALTMHSYIKFDLSSLPAGVTISNATLRLQVEAGGDGTQHQVLIHSTSSSWGETTITWANKPARGGQVGTLPAPLSPSDDVSANIAASAFSGAGVYSFVLAYPDADLDVHSDGISFISREGDPLGLGPCLDVTYALTPNQAPVLTAIPDQFMNEGTTRNVTITATDNEGDTLTYGASSDNTAVVTVSLANNIVTLNAIAVGTANVTVSVNDGVNPEVTDVFLVTVLAAGEPIPEPTEPPVIYTEEDHRRAQAPLCMDLSGQTNPAVRAAVPGDAVPGGNVYCRVLAQDGVFPNPNDPGRVGDPGLIAYGVITAVDIFGVTGDGMAYPGFNHAVTVCLEGSGRFIFLSALNSPRTTYEVPSVADGGYTCGSIPAAGTVVLIPFAPQN